MELRVPRPRPWMLVPVVALAAFAIVARRRARARTEAGETQPAVVGFMRAMHDACRRDLDRLEAVAPEVEQSGTVSDEVRAGWDGLRQALENHHAAEDEDLWPVLRPHLDTKAE